MVSRQYPPKSFFFANLDRFRMRIGNLPMSTSRTQSKLHITKSCHPERSVFPRSREPALRMPKDLLLRCGTSPPDFRLGTPVAIGYDNSACLKGKKDYQQIPDFASEPRDCLFNASRSSPFTLGQSLSHYAGSGTLHPESLRIAGLHVRQTSP